MKAVPFEEANINVAENQDEYQTLPARVYTDPFGEVISCWQLSDEEMEQIKKTNCIWVSQLTFKKGVAPMMLMAEKPDMEDREWVLDKGAFYLKTPEGKEGENG